MRGGFLAVQPMSDKMKETLTFTIGLKYRVELLKVLCMNVDIVGLIY